MKLPIQAAPVKRMTANWTFMKNDGGIKSSQVETRCQTCCNACNAALPPVPTPMDFLLQAACLARCETMSGGLCRC